jgi:acetylornithine deacetylase
MLPDMELFSLTRRLVDIESITGNERAVGEFLHQELTRRRWDARIVEVEPGRFNILAIPKGAHPALFFSTHMDTVPPFIVSSEDGERIWGRGSCDAKGIIAAQIMAAEKLRDSGISAGLLFLVGEERDSLGAKVANGSPMGSRFLINGEPTENRLAVASKGALRVEVIARGKMAHSAYPELGESAIDKLVSALYRLRKVPMPSTDGVGPTTVNVGVIEGGRAPNVIPDFARAQLLYRLVGPSDELKKNILDAVKPADAEFVLEIPFVRLRTLEGMRTMVAAFTTDIPALSNWGEPLLLGPGSIHVAHTEREHVEKRQLVEAVDLYVNIATQLLS